jgi:hypothetical protein
VKIRWCKACAERGRQRPSVMLVMQEMAKLKRYPCPHGKPECGKVVSK